MSSLLPISCLKPSVPSYYVLNLCKLLALIYKTLQDSTPTKLSDLLCHPSRATPLDPKSSGLLSVPQAFKFFHTIDLCKQCFYACHFFPFHSMQASSVTILPGPSTGLYKVKSWQTLDRWTDTQSKVVEVIHLLPIPLECPYFKHSLFLLRFVYQALSLTSLKSPLQCLFLRKDCPDPHLRKSALDPLQLLIYLSLSQNIFPACLYHGRNCGSPMKSCVCSTWDSA